MSQHIEITWLHTQGGKNTCISWKFGSVAYISWKLFLSLHICVLRNVAVHVGKTLRGGVLML